MSPITSKALIALLLCSSSALAAPLKVRQLAGEGSAANSILSGTDNAVGYGTEDAEDNLAQLITNTKGSAPARRQLAGEGSAADSILSDTDNAVGYGIEDAEDNLAQLITNTKGGAPAVKNRRQLDKISNGAQAVGNAAGVGSITTPVTSAGDTLDGELTSGAAAAGQQVGDTEVSTLEAAGSSVPTSLRRRQLDKIANGEQAVANAAGIGATAAPVTGLEVSADGQLTGDAATVGQQVGDDEVTVAEQAGSDVPTQA